MQKKRKSSAKIMMILFIANLQSDIIILNSFCFSLQFLAEKKMPFTEIVKIYEIESFFYIHHKMISKFSSLKLYEVGNQVVMDVFFFSFWLFNTKKINKYIIINCERT